MILLRANRKENEAEIEQLASTIQALASENQALEGASTAAEDALRSDHSYKTAELREALQIEKDRNRDLEIKLVRAEDVCGAAAFAGGSVHDGYSLRGPFHCDWG